MTIESLTQALVPQNLVLQLEGAHGLDVRSFSVREAMSAPFEIELVVVTPSVDVDFEAAIGSGARFEIHGSLGAGPRTWTGVCAEIKLTAVEESGLSTYAVSLRPSLWLLSQRRNYRVFQDKSELEIALEVLSAWGIAPRLDLDASAYPQRRYRTQYAETDLAFVSRMLEDIGVSYFFSAEGGNSTLVLSEAPQRGAPRLPVPFIASPTQQLRHEYVTKLVTGRLLRPGRYTQSDVDFRRPLDYPLMASSNSGTSIEASLERYHHNYGSFLWKGEGGGTPHADDRGPARTNEGQGAQQAAKRLEAQRANARSAEFLTTAYDLQPGSILPVVNHPRSELAEPLLVVACQFEGTAGGDWTHRCEARFASQPFRPALTTARPRTNGVESATVTGPAGEEIHTDEFGRVRLHFHWDREGAADETSSCWVPVAQPWAGAGMGAISLPRVGQEVVVDFLGADPDRPVVLGSVFTTTTPPPYKLPDLKMVSGIRSETYPRPKAGSPPQLGGGSSGAAPSPSLPLDDPFASASIRSLTTPRTEAVGGGPSPLHALGGGLDSLGLPTQTNNWLPGDYGGSPASLDEVKSSLERNRALGPDQQDVMRNANACVANDTAGQEQLYLQSQKDFMLLSKENAAGTIGANQVYTVCGNDTLTVNGYQKLGVGQNRTVEVIGELATKVGKDIMVETNMNHTLIAKQSISSIAAEGGHIEVSKILSLSSVGGSAILMLPDGIVIQSAKVFINPGVEFTNTAIETGDLAAAGEAQKAADAQRAEDDYQSKLDERKKALEEKLRQNGQNQAMNKRADLHNDPANWDASDEARTGLRYDDALAVYDDVATRNYSWFGQ